MCTVEGVEGASGAPSAAPYGEVSMPYAGRTSFGKTSKMRPPKPNVTTGAPQRSRPRSGTGPCADVAEFWREIVCGRPYASGAGWSS